MTGADENVLAVTLFSDHAARNKRQLVVTIDELAALIRDTSAPAKDRLPWLKLARFGNARSKHGSLRNNDNLIAITGIEADYDAEGIGFDQAVETAEKAGLRAILYSSPSHTPARPRWRVLAPTSREYPPADRARLLGRLNGLYGGVFGRESWTLSQSYYFGRVAAAPEYRVEIIDGQPIDRLDELDKIWLGPPAGGNDRDHAPGEDPGPVADAELVRRIVTGEGYHPEMTALAARHLGRGMRPDAVTEALRGLMLAHPPEARDGRWHDRFASIDAIVGSAAKKFAPEAERRRAIARLAHRLVRHRPELDGAEIRHAILAEAERLGVSAGAALAIGGGILREFEARHAR
jgi:hypothetical protein